jgi:hypothetical protein
MITENHKQEQLSKSYVLATAAAARINISVDQEHDYGIDGTFIGVSQRLQGISPDGTEEYRFVENGIKIDFQLKCSRNWRHLGNEVRWSIKNQTFNDLVGRPAYATPVVLILMCLPGDPSTWVASSEDSLIVRHCCYYATLTGAPRLNEESSTVIGIPRGNLLTPEALRALMDAEEARKQELFA